MGLDTIEFNLVIFLWWIVSLYCRAEFDSSFYCTQIAFLPFDPATQTPNLPESGLNPTLTALIGSTKGRHH